MKLIAEGPSGRKEFLIEKEVTVGRGGECDIRIDDPYLSRIDFTLTPAQGKIILKEISSRNGIRVKGNRVKNAELLPGEVFEAGNTRFVCIEEIDETLSLEVSGEAEEATLLRDPCEEIEERRAKVFEITLFVRCGPLAGGLGGLLLLLSLFFSQHSQVEKKKVFLPESERVKTEVITKREKNFPEELTLLPYEKKEEKESADEKKGKREGEALKKEKRENKAGLSHPNKNKKGVYKKTLKIVETQPQKRHSGELKEFVLFNFKKLIKKGERLSEEGKLENAVRVLEKACVLAGEKLEGAYLAECEGKLRNIYPLFVEKLVEKGKYAEAYGYCWKKRDFCGEEIKHAEDALLERLRELYAYSSVNPRGVRKSLEDILERIPPDSPLAERVSKLLGRLE